MTKEEFLLGIPFKTGMNSEAELTNIYSYVSVKGVQCIQEYSILNNMPRFHCKVIDIQNTRVLVSVNICGANVTHYVSFLNLQAIADKFGKRLARANKEKEEPLARFTHDCREARIFPVWDDPNMFYYTITDLQTGQIEPGKRCEYYNVEDAKAAAKKEIGYNDIL